MKFFERFYSEVTAALVFIIYISTLAPTIIHLDAGELTTVQATLGIAHPTGYPLFTMIGFLVSKIFFFANTIIILNLLAALYCAAAVLVFCKLIKLVLDNEQFLIPLSKKTKAIGEITPFQKSIIASVIGLSIGLSKTFWFQSTSVEVYSLHLFLISLILYVSLKAFYLSNVKYWYLLAVLLALSFSNHMTTILLLPGIAFLFFKQNGFKKESFILILKMLAIFFPVLIVIYLYLPLRAMQDPLLNWGNPIDLERFLRHVSGKQYQVWIFSSVEAAKKQLVYFINSLPTELGYAALITSLIGIPLTIKRVKNFSLFLTINFIVAVFYSINYDIADIDSYFLLAFISLTLLSLGSMVLFTQKIPQKFIAVLFLIPLAMMAVNYSEVDQSEKYAFEDYTKSILENTAQDGIVFSYLWDYFVSPSYYYQYVDEFRKDVAVIDKELLRRSWYFNQLSTNMPGITNKIQPQIKKFLKSLQPFERDERFDANIIENNYRSLMTSLISSNIGERDFYITPELVEGEMKRGEFQLPEGYTLVPMELTFKVVKISSAYVPAEPTKIKIRFSSHPHHYEMIVRNMVSNMLIYRVYYELQYNELEKAKLILEKLKMEYPDYRIPPAILDKLGNG